MNRLILPAIAAGAALAGVALANETEEFCISFATVHDLGTEECGCVGEVGEANPDVKAALLALNHPDELQNWDPALQEKLAVCFPQSVAAQ